MVAAVRRSGHTRLKAALVLRDALAAELGVSLPAAMAQLRTVENHIGAPRALSDGRYREAMLRCARMARIMGIGRRKGVGHPRAPDAARGTLEAQAEGRGAWRWYRRKMAAVVVMP